MSRATLASRAMLVSREKGILPVGTVACDAGSATALLAIEAASGLIDRARPLPI
jgi:hypothetical protein